MTNSIDPSLVPTKILANGSEIPCIGFGTFGSDRFGAEQVAEAVMVAIKAGYRLIDCAAVYGNEDLIGKVFKEAFDSGIVKREEMFITSKVWNDKHSDVLSSCEKSLSDLKLDYVDAYFVHWPFPNYHAPGCDGDARNPDSKPFSVDRFMDTWRQMEDIYEKGYAKNLGMSNMTIPKLEAVLPLCKIKPTLIEMELHPCFQQTELFNYCVEREVLPIGFSPIGSPNRPDRDKTAEDFSDVEQAEVVEAAKAHGIHPALVCLKWAMQRGQVPIPFSVNEKNIVSNLCAATEDYLTDDEMESLKNADKNCRLIKGQVFLWEGARGWEDLWDLDGRICK